jgi:glycosyltransferase involved in cell wall biosynthesis
MTRILMPVVHFDLLSGSSLHVYELGRVLAARGHEVTVAAPTIGGEITRRAQRHGIRVTELDVETTETFDIVHTHQHDPGVHVMERFPRVPVVSTIHSPLPPDRPIRSDRVRAFVCVRPEIRQKIVTWDRVADTAATVVFNGIDFRRFTPAVPHTPKADDAPGSVLFVGTITHRRRPVLKDLVAYTAGESRTLEVVGIGPDDWLAAAPSHVTWNRREVWNIEDHIRAAHEVASIALSRTAIEAWACGKPARIYDVDHTPTGRICHVDVHPPPPPAISNLFDVEYMASEIERVYEAAM